MRTHATMIALLGSILLTGCSKSGTGMRTPKIAAPEVLRSDVRTPFAPKRLRVHPLTALSRDDANQRIITLYVELFDAWGDSVKAVGLLTAEVVEGGLENEERRWNVDLFDMEINGPAYDEHTRTYRFLLGDLPDWVVEGSRVRVLLQTLNAQGEPRDLYDEVDLR